MAKKPWRIRRGVWELLEDTPTNRKDMKIAISDKIEKGKIDSIKGVLIGENKTPHRIGALDKFQKGEVPYITFRDKEARKVSTAARLGSAKDQLSMSSEPYSAKVREHMVDEFGKGLKIKPTSKLHGHHVRMLQMYRPFFQGLDPKDKAALADFAQKTKFPLGDAKANIAILDEVFHQQIHKFMIDKGYQVRKGLPKVKGIPDLGNTFESRKAALQHFFTNVQEPIERKLSKIKWNQQAKYNPMSEADVQEGLAWLNDKATKLELKSPKADVTELGKRLGGIGDKLKIGKGKALLGAGLGLQGLGIFGDGYDAVAGTTGAFNKNKSKLEQSASALQGMSGGLGLASLKFPPALIPSLAAKGAELHIRNRSKKEKERYLTAKERLKDIPKNLTIKQRDKYEGISSL
jgi:hypothetical protein